MNYQITCVCGNRFFIDADHIGRHVACPACNRALIPLAAQSETAAPTALPPLTTPPITTSLTSPLATPTPLSTPAPTLAEPTKRCPFCGEVILAIARKCRHCNEFLDRAPPPANLSGAAAQAAVTEGTANAAAPDQSPPVFALSVSQWDNIFRYLICLAVVVVTGVLVFGANASLKLLSPSTASLIFAAVLVAAGLLAYFYFLATKSARCTIRATRIETETGIFSKKVDSLEMFRIIDVELKQNLIERIVGIGTVLIKSTDETSPELELYQIPQARKVQRFLLDQIPKADKERGAVRVQR